MCDEDEDEYNGCQNEVGWTHVIWYSVFSNCSTTVTVSPSGPPGLFKGVTTAMSGVLARFPLLLPVPKEIYGTNWVCIFWADEDGIAFYYNVGLS